ncbi:acetyltransferase (GNAT) family protein [Knoellia remsis]|uniref:Acetyltransferase (GNAT) family protein n=1 Tax=Knoellia remsis TaxID=407159 RepID=A0A2T0UFF1_9MICO|nr:GNAT family N-acetyltransferase [Knoellia remsis]PRY56669.1 acetyltransferase (GNAT) family protein [Knoellia remsis]
MTLAAPVVRLAEPRDAFAVAALTMQDDRECGATIEPGFLDRYADAWLADRRRVTFLAEAADGRPLGMVTAAIVTKLPSSRRPDERWLHVSLLFVTADARGAGLGGRLIEALQVWASDNGVTRMQLSADPKARSLYERAGFTTPDSRLMEWRRG